MSRNPAKLPRRTPSWLAFCIALALPACASTYVQVPPRLELEPHGRVALVRFTNGSGGDARLATLATERFAEVVLANQSGFELFEVDGAGLPAGDEAALAQALGERKGVTAVFVGDLAVSTIRPTGGFGAGGGTHVGAMVDATLSVRLLSAESGGTVWRARSTASAPVGTAVRTGGLPSVQVRSPDEAYGEVVNEVVVGVTRDLRPTRVRQ
jgi:hypothetical protein